MKRQAARGRPVATEKSAETLGFRVNPDDRNGITMAASVNRSSLSGLIDQAVARYAQDIGVANPPPGRAA